jgi:hypothetical protein
VNEEEKPTSADVDAALRLSRKYMYDGHEPYAPAVMSFARMLAAYRVEVLREVICDAAKELERRRKGPP